ncbi:MAG: hypothetical protein PUH15_08035 [Dialister sp.]|nr:hypothetical protein [Dialister sp.]MDY5544966.1 hypothetical protein [Dialister sp.]
MPSALPIAFNNHGYALVATANGDASNTGSIRVVKELSKNQIQIIREKQPSDAMGSYWIDIGE